MFSDMTVQKPKPLSIYSISSIFEGEWTKNALCRGMDTDLFFPPTGRRPTQAIATCDKCSVKNDCLEWALANHVHWGVWGGMTERDRFREKRRRRELNGDS